jgi:hypothetical protein
MKKHLPPLAIRKNFKRYHFISSRIVVIIVIRAITNVNDVEKLGPSYTTGGNIKWCRHVRKQSGSSSKCYPHGNFKKNKNICPHKNLYACS